MGFIIFTFLIAFIPETLDSFLAITTYFILVFGLIEITFMFSILNSKSAINKNIIFSRLAIGGLNLIGGFILMLTLFKNPLTALTIAGILVILSGIIMLWFSKKIK